MTMSLRLTTAAACPPVARRRWPARAGALAAAALLAMTLAAPAQAQSASRRAARTLPDGGSVTMNFVNADIDAVSRAMAAMIDRQLVVDPRVKGQITVYSEQPLTLREAFAQYLAALRGLGFAVVDSAGLMKVVPEADAKLQTGTVLVGPVIRSGDQVITQIFRLQHENPNNLVAVLRPLISPNNTINANPGNATLVITDYADNLARLGKIIAALDVPAATDVEVVPLQHAIASDLVTMVQRVGDGGSPAAGVPGMAGGATTVLADPRANALIIRAANPAKLAAMRGLIRQLDRPSVGGAAGQIHVVYLKNADATKLATVLRAAFGSGAGSAGASGGGFTGANVGGAAQTPGAAGAAANSPATAPLSASAQPSTGGFIQADPASNALVITAPEPIYRQLRAVIDQLDGRRAQVYIESMIVEVSGDNATDFGFQWQGISRHGNEALGAGVNSSIGGPNILNLTTTLAGGVSGLSASSTLPGEGFNIGVLRKIGSYWTIGAIARMLQSQSNVNIVSTPNLITLDNEEAKIVVGSNVPFITGQFTSTGTGTSNPFQTIERKDVGLTLRIRPQVGESGTVRLQIFQEKSSVSDKVAPGTSNAGPSTDKRSIESNVIVDDGAVLVLGGLIEDRYAENRSKVPLLGDLPYVGALFRSESRTRTRTNLMVFLRPIVLRDANASSVMAADRYDLIRAQQQQAQPVPNPLLPIDQGPIVPARPDAPASSPGLAPLGLTPAPQQPPATEPPAATSGAVR